MTTAHPIPAAGPAQQEPEPATAHRPWTVLVLALAAQLLVVLDISVVNTALPTIGRSLRLDGSDLQWLVTAYLLMSGGGLLFGGRITDLLPRRRVFLTGLAVFTLASLASGFAGGATPLIAARAAQGLGAALMIPAALSIVMTTYAGEQRRRGLALWGAIGSMAVAGGVLLGGVLTTWAGWQLIFWINVPVGATALVVGLVVLPKETRGRSALGEFDVPGALTVVGGLAALMVALGATSTHGWLSARTLVPLAVAVLLLSAFVLVERRAVRPLVPPHTWKVSSLVSGTTVLLGAMGILVGTVFLCSVYFQVVLGFSALVAGVAFLPLALAITVGTHIAGRLAPRVAPRTVAALGLGVTAAGAVLLSTVSGSSGFAAHVLPGLLVLGTGIGLVVVAVSVSAMTGIPPQHAGLASGFLMTGHEVGAALGVAVLSAVAAAAGSLTTADGVVDGVGSAFAGTAVLAGMAGILAYRTMPSTAVTGGAGHVHLH